MDRMPCGVTADLRRYEREQEEAEIVREMAEAAARQEAYEAVNDAEVVREMVYDYEVMPDACLARCFANLDKACAGERYALDAICTALSNYRREMVEKRVDTTIDEVERQLRGW